MKTLITYTSKTGNTKKIAEAINEVIKADLIDYKENPDIEKYDNVIVGYWADRGMAPKDFNSFMEKIRDKNCGVFATLGADPDSDHGKNVINYGIKKLESQNNKVLSKFICRGKIDPKLTQRMKESKVGPHAWNEERRKTHEMAASHPDLDDIKNAKKAFENFLLKVES